MVRATSFELLLESVAPSMRRSALPATADEQSKLAKRLDYNQSEHFVKDYNAARETIHALYERHVKARLN